MNDNCYLLFFKYFSKEIEKNRLNLDEKCLMANTLYDMKVIIPDDNKYYVDDSSQLPMKAVCVARKIIIKEYLDNNINNCSEVTREKVLTKDNK